MVADTSSSTTSTTTDQPDTSFHSRSPASAKTDCKDISGHRNCNRNDECQWARKNIDSKSKSCIDYVEVSVTDVNTTVTVSDVDATATNATNATNATEDLPANVQTAEQTETRTETNPSNTVETFFPLTYVISLQARETHMRETMDYFGVEHPTFVSAPQLWPSMPCIPSLFTPSILSHYLSLSRSLSLSLSLSDFQPPHLQMLCS